MYGTGIGICQPHINTTWPFVSGQWNRHTMECISPRPHSIQWCLPRDCVIWGLSFGAWCTCNMPVWLAVSVICQYCVETAGYYWKYFYCLIPYYSIESNAVAVAKILWRHLQHWRYILVEIHNFWQADGSRGHSYYNLGSPWVTFEGDFSYWIRYDTIR